MHQANKEGIIHLSINPWYFCNFRCKFCYLTPEQLADRQLLSLEDLDRRIYDIISAGYRPGHADIYGGEVMLLPKGYLQDMKKILHDHDIDEIEIITNLSALNKDVIDDPDWGISVSYDFSERERHEEVLMNMLKLDRPFTILTLATPEVLKMDPSEMLMQLSMLRNLSCWEIKPYSSNQANQAPMDYVAFEELVKGVITSPIPRNFAFMNKGMIEDAVAGYRNSFSDDHVYIAPSGKFAVLEFDEKDNEYFLELESFKEYLEWCTLEKNRVYDDSLCSNCEFLGGCLSEHLRQVKSLDHSCNGFHNLIVWMKEQS